MWEGDSGSGQKAQARSAAQHTIAWLVALVLAYCVALLVLNFEDISSQARAAINGVLLGLVNVALTTAGWLPSSLNATAIAVAAASASGLTLLVRAYGQGWPQLCTRATWSGSFIALVLQCGVALSVLQSTSLTASYDVAASSFLFAASVAVLVLWAAAFTSTFTNYVAAASRPRVRHLWYAQLGISVFTGCLVLTHTSAGAAHNLLATLALSMALVGSLLLLRPAPSAARPTH